MDSLDWSKKYEVLSISRQYLRSLGFTGEQIESLSDEDMQHIADDLQNGLLIGFAEDAKFAASIVLVEKRNA